MKDISTDQKESALKAWNPEDSSQWEGEGKRLAWRTLWITTYCLILSFTTWFMVSAIVVKLNGAGFDFDTQQLFWLAAMPGVAAGTLRIVHTFLIPIFGTRLTITASTLLLLIPALGWGFAVMNPETSYGTFLILGFAAGLGGGNFSSFMPSTSLFFPKSKQGTALGIQAGIGNFGVSLVQFLVPILLGIGMYGSSQLFFGNDGQAEQGTAIYLQNAAFIWVPFIIIGVFAAWFGLKSVPVKANFREQLDIFKNRDTWLMTSLYVMTFGSFSGFAAAFPAMIGKMFGGFEGAPEPLKYAFLGPLIGAAVRALAGPVCDKLGGGRVTTFATLGLIACTFGATAFTNPASMDAWTGFLWCMLGIFFFSGVGNASTFKQMPMIFPPRQAGGVIGWTSAIAAYGPFLFAVPIGMLISNVGHPTMFFFVAGAFFVVNLCINWWFYARKNAPKPC